MAESNPSKTPPKAPMEEKHGDTELLDTLQRVQADFENYRKRSLKELAESQLHGKVSAFRDMLGFADTLDAATQHASPETKPGFESLRQQLMHIFKQNGIIPMHTLGKKFDPHQHECLMQGNDTQKEDGMILEEFQKGYLFHQDVLRTAKVKVNMRDSETETHATEGGMQHE